MKKIIPLFVCMLCADMLLMSLKLCILGAQAYRQHPDPVNVEAALINAPIPIGSG